jgi:hypothetical protein
VFRVGVERFGHLDGEFPRGGEHEGLHALAPGSSLSRMGRAKAAVLPVPVCAWPTTSRPPRSSGMVFCWMGEGASYPTPEIAQSSGSPRPNWSNESKRTSAFAFIMTPLRERAVSSPVRRGSSLPRPGEPPD